MKRPSRLRILGKLYRVTFTEGEPLAADEEGLCDPGKQELYIRPGASLECEQDSVIHEVVHVWEELLSIRLSHENVVRLTTAIHQLIRDNPGLLAYLRRKP